MKGKEFFKMISMSFFIIVTLINVAIFVLGSIFNADARFGYEAFLMPVLYGACSLVPVIVTYSKRELTVKELIFRKLLQLISIEVILYLLVFGFNSEEGKNIGLVASFCASVFVIYVLEYLISLFLNMQTAKKLNKDLHRYQETMRE